MLDDDLPVWVPIPPLAEVQVALEEAVAEVTGLSGYELKRIMRTGTVATIDNRNWELRDQRGPVQRLSQSRAIALDMEMRDDRRQRLPLPRALRHAALRLRQAAARRAEAARHGDRLLQAPGRPAPAHRHPRRGDARATCRWSGCIRASSGASPRPPFSRAGLCRAIRICNTLPQIVSDPDFMGFGMHSAIEFPVTGRLWSPAPRRANGGISGKVE